MVKRLLLNEGIAEVKELQVKIVLATLAWMLYAIVRNQVLSVQSNYVILPIGDTSRSHVHGDDHG